MVLTPDPGDQPDAVDAQMIITERDHLRNRRSILALLRNLPTWSSQLIKSVPAVVCFAHVGHFKPKNQDAIQIAVLYLV